MKTSININSEKVSRKQLFRQLVELQISLKKYRSENSYSQEDEAKAIIHSIDRLPEKIIDEEE